MATEDFKVLLDRRVNLSLAVRGDLNISHARAAWNPRMDVLALVHGDSGVVALYRTGIGEGAWNRVALLPHPLASSASASAARRASLSPRGSKAAKEPPLVACVEWRQRDGEVLGVAYADGSLAFFTVEGALVAHFPGSAPAGELRRSPHLAWDASEEPRQQGTVRSYEDRAARFLPQMGLFGGGVHSSGRKKKTKAAAAQLSSGTGLDILLSCSSRSSMLSVDLLAHGTFAVGCIDLNASHVLAELAEFKTKLAAMYSACMSRDYSKVFTVCCGEDGDVYLITFDTSVLSSRLEELMLLTVQADHLKLHLENAARCIEALEEKWSAVKNTFESISGKYPAVLSSTIRPTPSPRAISYEDPETAEDGTLADDLLLLLTCGHMTQSLQLFLCDEITQASLSRAAKSIDFGCVAIVRDLILQQLKPTIENIVFRLGELEGLVKWEERFQSIGLDPKSVEHAVGQMGGVLLRVENLIDTVAAVRADFACVFLWLLRVQHDLVGVSAFRPPISAQHDETRLMRILKSGFSLERVEQCLYGTPDISIKDDVVRGSGLYTYTLPTASFFSQTFSDAVGSCNELMAMPNTVLSQNISVDHVAALMRGKSVKDVYSYCPLPKHMDQVDDSKQSFMLVSPGEEGGDDVYIVKATVDGHELSALRIRFENTVLQCQFYHSEQLVVLLHDEGSGTRLSLVQYSDAEWTNCEAHSNALCDIPVWEEVEVIGSRHLSPPSFSNVAVGAGRGLALVYSDRRLAVVDLAVDDEEEEEEDE